MTRKRYLWIRVIDSASEAENQHWQRFVRVTKQVSPDVRFLDVETVEEYERKRDILEAAGWQVGRWGDGLMSRVIFLTKEYDE